MYTFHVLLEILYFFIYLIHLYDRCIHLSTIDVSIYSSIYPSKEKDFRSLIKSYERSNSFIEKKFKVKNTKNHKYAISTCRWGEDKSYKEVINLLKGSPEGVSRRMWNSRILVFTLNKTKYSLLRRCHVRRFIFRV